MKVRVWGRWGTVLKEKEEQWQKSLVFANSSCPQITDDESKTLCRVSSEALDKLESGERGIMRKVSLKNGAMERQWGQDPGGKRFQGPKTKEKEITLELEDES